MVDTYRSAGATEIKFLVAPALADRVRAWARQHLAADPHGGGQFGDTYTTTTIYLDTPALDVFHRRGSNGRAKYRIRRYGDEVTFIERKLRTQSKLAKRRTRVTPDELARLAGATPDHTWAGEWFHRRLVARQLRPSCAVRYTRMARAIDTVNGTARLTVDDALLGGPAEALAFGAAPTVGFLEGHAILELKFRKTMPGVFKQLMTDLALTPGTVSKYRHAMVALGRAEFTDAVTPVQAR